MADLRHPIGPFVAPERNDAAQRNAWIDSFERLPQDLRRLIDGWTDSRLDTPYRGGGWTVRQVVHHIADSHINGYTRMRLALTESRPVIKPYDQNAWAELPDASSLPPETSLSLLEALHARWTCAYREMSEEQWQRELFHPEDGTLRLDTLAALYDWHGRHHLGHIKALAEREAWL